MTHSVLVADLLANPAELMNRVVGSQETLSVLQDGRVIAEIRPVQQRSSETLADLFRSLPHLPPEDVEAFANDIETARRELNELPTRDPWES